MLLRALCGSVRAQLAGGARRAAAAAPDNSPREDAHMVTPRLVTVAHGDGIGPEIMDATLRVLEAARAPLRFEPIEIGEQVYARGVSSGIDERGWDSLRRTRVFLKAPITTPTGGGVKSLNVTVRKTLGLYANVRPVHSYHPFVRALHPAMDLVVVRENEEDLYAGIEHRHTAEVMQCLKLISVPGTERICRYAFEYARAHGRKKVTCVVKDNIMKLTDGTFYDVFKRVAARYPDIRSEHRIVDIATAHVASKPQTYDVIVTLNLYGDIISDVAAEVAGSVGLAGSANIGNHAAMFEAVHGSAPDIAGKDIANPSGLLNGAVMMLGHLGLHATATRVRDALLCTLEDGIHTADVFSEGAGSYSRRRAGTREFADAVIERLGRTPVHLRSTQPPQHDAQSSIATPGFSVPEAPVLPTPVKAFAGVDVFVDWDRAARDPDALAADLRSALGSAADRFDLVMISNRGVKVWPHGQPETYKVDHWRCRFMLRDSAAGIGSGAGSSKDALQVAQALVDGGLDVIKTENLYSYDGKPGFSLGQGQ